MRVSGGLSSPGGERVAANREDAGTFYAPPVATHPSRQFAISIESSNPSATDGGATGGPGVAAARVKPAGAGWAQAEAPVCEQLKSGAGREDDLMPAIDRLLKRLGAAPGEIVLVAVSVGPGGFTALRVAVSIVKILSFATGAACAAVPTACVVARRTRADSGPLAVLLAGKGDSAFATVFGPADLSALADGGPLEVPPGRIVRAADMESLGLRSIVADRFVPAPILAAAQRLGIARTMPEYDAVACLELGLRMPPISADHLAPIYPREPEAVVKWRQLHPGS